MGDRSGVRRCARRVRLIHLDCRVPARRHPLEQRVGDHEYVDEHDDNCADVDDPAGYRHPAGGCAPKPPTTTKTTAKKSAEQKAASAASCAQAKAAGAAPLYAGQPGYAKKLDRDGDGVACET